MTTQLPTRAAIDAAGDMEWNARKPAKQDILIVVKATVDGYPVELSFSGSIDQLLGITRKLREMGAQPQGVAISATPEATRKPKSERVTPAYSDDGSALCPVHRRELKQGQWGLYCSAKDKETGEYCKLKFTE